MRVDPDTCTDVALLRAEVKRLRAIIDADRPQVDRPEELDTTPPRNSTPTECSVPPEWTSKPYWVDPPSGWQYGFPRLYDPANDGDMVEWLIASGYPEKLARQGLTCTFTAAQ